jgi:hypothetical protein
MFCALHEDYPIQSDLVLSEVGTDVRVRVRVCMYDVLSVVMSLAAKCP